jgi:alkylhydroperoxidase family enzyme
MALALCCGFGVHWLGLEHFERARVRVHDERGSGRCAPHHYESRCARLVECITELVAVVVAVESIVVAVVTRLPR